jgi:hypothetical protein
VSLSPHDRVSGYLCGRDDFIIVYQPVAPEECVGLCLLSADCVRCFRLRRCQVSSSHICVHYNTRPGPDGEECVWGAVSAEVLTLCCGRAPTRKYQVSSLRRAVRCTARSMNDLEPQSSQHNPTQNTIQHMKTVATQNSRGSEESALGCVC